MARILVTGSAEGLGLLAGRRLAEEGHAAVLHARNATRADDARQALPCAEDILVGDVSTIAGCRMLAEAANATGAFDAVIHNAGIGPRTPQRTETEDGLSQLFAVNVLAPYLLTALMIRPGRLVYLSSGMHEGGDASLEDLQWRQRRWNGSQAYSDSKLFDVALAQAVGRRWRMPSSAVTPGWVPTRMGGAGAPEDLELGAVTQAWLAASDDEAARTGGGYWKHQRRLGARAEADDPVFQDALLGACAELTDEEL